MLPEISVLMPSYNADQWVGETIESVLNQTFKNFEFIIVDDGSRDNTLRIIRSYAAKDPRIKIVAKSHSGVVATLNAGLAQARGEWIARLDSDDWCYPERLEKQINYLRRHPEIDVLGAGVELIGPDRKVQNILFPSENHEEIIKNLFKKTLFFNSTVVMKRKFLREVGGYNKACYRSEDFELWVRGIRGGYIYHNLHEVLVKYRTNDYQRSWKTIGKYFIDKLYVSIRYRYFIKGLCASIVEVARLILIRFGLYRPSSLKKAGFKNQIM